MKILIVQTSFLGDTILSTPVISGLKKIYPDSELWMMTTPLSSSLVKRDPLLAGVIPYDKRSSESGFKGLFKMGRYLKEMKFDKVYSLHRSYRTSALLLLSGIPRRIGFKQAKFSFIYHKSFERNPNDHDVIRNLGILKGDIGLDNLDMEMRLFAPEPGELSHGLETILPEPKSYAVLVPGSAWETKMWDTEGFHKTALYLKDKGMDVVLLGSPEDMETNQKVAKGLDILDLAGKTSISDALYIVKHSKLVVCNDSMSLHMASAFKIPTVAVFCATSPSLGFGPWKTKAIVVEKDLECRPCSRHGERRCPNGTDACMKELSHTEVISAINRLIDID